MQVEAAAESCEWGALKLGDLFLLRRAEEDSWGIRVALTDNEDAMVLVTDDPSRGGSPALYVGSMSNDSFLRFPNAIVRPDWNLARSRREGIFVKNALIAVEGRLLISATISSNRVFYFDVATGVVQERPESLLGHIFPSWECGLMRDNMFMRLKAFGTGA